MADTVERKPLDEVLERAREVGNHTVWDRITNPRLHDGLRSRDIFTYALVLCELRKDLWRVGRLLRWARRMQIRDRRRRDFGNFHWQYGDRRRRSVKDKNAVEFCIRGAILIWIRHHKHLTSGQCRLLKRIIMDSLPTMRRQRVPVKHSNIALMNAMNLILVGEVFREGRAAQVGYTRLQDICVYTWEWGMHEYCSPTYSAIQLYCLALIGKYTADPETEAVADGLLEVVWEIVRCNWISSQTRLGGAQARQEELYVEGDGTIEEVMWALGYLEPHPGSSTSEAPYPPNMTAVYIALAFWSPKGDDVSPVTLERYRQSWGPDRMDVRSYGSAGASVSLSVSESQFDYPDNQDIPLTVDFHQPYWPTKELKHPLSLVSSVARNRARCFFVPSERLEPYSIRYRHLVPLSWSAVQDGLDALAIALYHPFRRDILDSNVILPSNLWFWRVSADKACQIPIHQHFEGACEPSEVGEYPVGQHDVLLGVRPSVSGLSAVAVRPGWATTYTGDPAPCQLSVGGAGQEVDAVRLYARHHQLGEVPRAPQGLVGLAVWVRVQHFDVPLEPGLLDNGIPTQIVEWVSAMTPVDAMDVEAGENEVNATTTAGEDQLMMRVWRPDPSKNRFESACSPSTPKYVLGSGSLVDGNVSWEDKGRSALSEVGAIRRYVGDLVNSPAIRVPDSVQGGGTTVWEAEAGRIYRPMRIGRGTGASGGRYIVMRPRDGHGSVVGSAAYQLDVKDSRAFTLWGRLCCDRPGHSRLTVRINYVDAAANYTIVEEKGPWIWRIPVHEGWTWVPLGTEGGDTATVIDLDQGTAYLHIYPRESGVRIDQLKLQGVGDIGPVIGEAP